jgi:hypothetical protein
MQTQTAIAPSAPAAVSLVAKILAPTTIAVGLALTVAWVFLLGYGLVTLIEIVI